MESSAFLPHTLPNKLLILLYPPLYREELRPLFSAPDILFAQLLIIDDLAHQRQETHLAEIQRLISGVTNACHRFCEKAVFVVFADNLANAGGAVISLPMT